jgi:hypothetical protein
VSEPGGTDDSTAADLRAEDIHAPNDQQAATPIANGGRRRKGGRGEKSMVPEATFTSYYGRPVVRPSPWEADIPAYLFLGGLAGGSSLLAAGADLTRRPELRRSARTTALVAVSLSAVALIHDLGRPERFHHMLRVAKVTSPMSVGTWILTAYGPMAGIAAITEARPAASGVRARLAAWPLVALHRAQHRRAGGIRGSCPRLIHRGAAHRHGHADLARREVAPALRVRGQRGRGVRGHGHGVRAARAERPSASGSLSRARRSTCSSRTRWSSPWV